MYVKIVEGRIKDFRRSLNAVDDESLVPPSPRLRLSDGSIDGSSSLLVILRNC